MPIEQIPTRKINPAKQGGRSEAGAESFPVNVPKPSSFWTKIDDELESMLMLSRTFSFDEEDFDYADTKVVTIR